MKKDFQFKKAVTEVVLIVVIASVVGICVNFFHPNGAVIALSRPDAVYVSDQVLLSQYPPETDGLTEPVVVNREQLKKLLIDNRAVLLDARMPGNYAEGHLPGAVNVPFELLGQFMDKINTLPRGDWVIAYCDGPPCDLGELLARELKNMGFTRVAFYPDGVDDWLKAGGPVARGGE